MLNKNLILNFLSLITIVLIFNACAGSNLSTPTLPSKETPAWVSSPPPNDNKIFMYGMSIEEDRDLAIKAALSDMIAKLGTTIESTYESDQEVQGSYSSLLVKNKIKSNISKIKINNYKVIKSHKVSYREFAVLIETNKKKLADGLKDELALEKKNISQKYDSLKNSDALTMFNTKKELSLRAKELMPLILMIAELDVSFNKSKNLEFVYQKKKEFLSESKKLKFYITGNKKSNKFISIIKNHLASKGFNISNSKKNALHIKINTTDNINRSHYLDIAVLNLELSVYDKSKRIGGKSIILKERYNGSKDSVYKNASIHLKQDIKSLGVNEVIGINLD